VRFVPPDFVPPERLENELFVLEPLAPEHNERDHEAWSTSIEHIRSTPGFEGRSWPRELTLEENRADLERHARDFEQRSGFTYTVLDGDEGIGCVYIYPLEGVDRGAKVTSWVRASRAELDEPLWRAVSDWLDDEWPFAHVDYAERGRRRDATAPAARRRPPTE
jgi:hypothetical protein